MEGGLAGIRIHNVLSEVYPSTDVMLFIRLLYNYNT